MRNIRALLAILAFGAVVLTQVGCTGRVEVSPTGSSLGNYTKTYGKVGDTVWVWAGWRYGTVTGGTLDATLANIQVQVGGRPAEVIDVFQGRSTRYGADLRVVVFRIPEVAPGVQEIKVLHSGTAISDIAEYRVVVTPG